jgi:hypothetical protein
LFEWVVLGKDNEAVHRVTDALLLCGRVFSHIQTVTKKLLSVNSKLALAPFDSSPIM